MKDFNHRLNIENSVESLSILQVTLDSISDGVLVIDRNGNIVACNHRFLELWNIPESLVEAGDDNKLLMFVQNQLKNPDEFIALVNSAYINPDKHVNDILEFKDGKVFERYSQPQKVENEIVGRIWCFRDITYKNISEKSLELQRIYFTQLFVNSPEAICILDTEDRFIDVNAAFEKLFGYSKEELINCHVNDKVVGSNLIEEATKISNDVMKGNVIEFEAIRRTRDGSNVNVLILGYPLIFEDKQIGVFGIYKNITERKQAEEAIKSSEFTFRMLFEGSSDAILILEGNKVIDCNQATIELLGYNSKTNILGKSPWEFSPEKQPDGKLSKEKVLEILRITQNKGKFKFEWWHQKSDNTLIPVEIMLTSILLNGKKVFHALCRDVGERKQMEQKLEYLSYNDQLTGLYNRRFFEEELNRLDVKRNLPLTIVMADVNGLKLVNDSFGHVIGDELLKKVAEVMSKGFRADDIIARLGGDEFVVLLPNTDAYETEQIVKRIKGLALKEKVGSIDISISFGYETKTNVKEKIHEIFKKAEDQMYKKKLFESPSMRGKTIKVIISTLHEKNKREEQHSLRVSALCQSMGEAIGLTEEEIEELRTVGLLHDIGKIAIEENILNKPGKLTSDEWEEIKRHPEIGYRILSTVNDMSEMAEHVLAHHERWDGRGYPKGLKGKEIPFQSRIMAIADAYDAMTSERSYRSALPERIAIEELQKNSGIQFDPKLIKIFVSKVLESHDDVIVQNGQ
jgi:diguanylate cyclase (GGDEF)-like protein/PAS domain S-box-containing protein/putative nucleotidyltransferase with HDIG domain